MTPLQIGDDVSIVTTDGRILHARVLHVETGLFKCVAYRPNNSTLIARTFDTEDISWCRGTPTSREGNALKAAMALSR